MSGARGWAEAYLAVGWVPIPIPYKTKIPGDGWDERTLESARKSLETDFPEGSPMNFGVLLGAPSGDLVDLDLDCPEAIALAPDFLPATPMTFGRAGARRAHWEYVAKFPKTEQFRDPTAPKEQKAMIVEIRSTGGQTVFPGSVHPSGEAIEFDLPYGGPPAHVDADDLRMAVKKLAAAAALAHYWPAHGRNEAQLALAGGLLSAGWSDDDALEFLCAICRVSPNADEERSKRERTIRGTREKIDNGLPFTSWKKLEEAIPPNVVKAAAKWLGAPKTPQTTELIQITDGWTYFHNAEGDAFATIETRGHLENLPVRSMRFREFLSHAMFKSKGKPAGGEALQAAVNYASAKAYFDGPELPTRVRTAEHDGAIWIDLGDPAWQAIEVTAEGWTVRPSCEVVPRFIHPKGLKPLPVPVRGGSIESLREFINVEEGDWPLIVAWVLAALRPTGPYPVLALQAEQGTGKSTLGKLLRALVDPNAVPLRSKPKDTRDLTIAAKNGHVIALTNLSGITSEISDALCCIATDEGFATRGLYTNDEEALFQACRPIILNGIGALVTRGDLASRSIIIAPPAIANANRRLERELWRAFGAAQPGIFGALLDAISGALARVETIELATLPRMADFAKWAVAAEAARGAVAGEFMKAYEANQDDAAEATLEADPVAMAVIKFATAKGTWKGTPTDLLERLNETRRPTGAKFYNQVGQAGPDDHWPRSSTILSGKLRRAAPALRRLKRIEVTFSKSNGSKQVAIVWTPRTAAEQARLEARQAAAPETP